ncbi:hypothetical protein B296_00052115 [Ensete ventricosum]|uniref:Uncharacterized protein n=1 Tax=Ensete ventricosum TaxID=4639 RepID=A0A426X8D9_ENSVE|nr:hypothetical protein B296_00052115 [Ensete ventricosum]
MARRLALYSERGTCWKPLLRSGRDASLAPKKTATAAGGSPKEAPSIARSNTFSAHRVLYPLYPRSTMSA